MLMDEFTTLGRVGIIAKSIGQIAGFNMRLLLVIQGISQLIAAYGEQDARTIEDMCVVQLLYPPRAQKDANEYSEMLGAYTAKATSTGISRPRAFGNNNGSASENVSDQRRSLMLPQELRELPWENEIIIKQGIKPILCNKAFYFTDPVFLKRLKAVSSMLAGVKGMPTEKQIKEAALTRGDLSTSLPKHDVNLHMARVREARAGGPAGRGRGRGGAVDGSNENSALDPRGGAAGSRRGGHDSRYRRSHWRAEPASGGRRWFTDRGR